VDHKRLLDLLNDIKDVHIGVVGDACLDVYWHADMKQSEMSRETPHFPLPVVEELHFLGAGGNVAANVVGLGCKNVDLLTVIGLDWRAYELHRLLLKTGMATNFVVEDINRITPAYCKPFRHGVSEVVYEDPRIDFVNRSPLPNDVEEKVLSVLDRLSQQTDGILISDQFYNGVITNQVREAINELALGRKIFVDSRNCIGKFKNAIVKPNEIELFAAVGQELDRRPEAVFHAAQLLVRQNQQSVCVTLGEKGCMWVNEVGYKEYPAVSVFSPVDIVGAGDAFMAAFATALTVGANQDEAVALGSLAASITIKKIGMAGVVSVQELLQQSEN
jgi:rfaE bifunctional protein kinase chain/domain